MWGSGGRYYWGRKSDGDGDGDGGEGIVVGFAWMSSQEKHLKNYLQLYDSLGWKSLICHSEFLNLFFPEKATSLALGVLNELIKVVANKFLLVVDRKLQLISSLKELKIKPCPVVFISFSGGPKACMYKVLQIIDGKCEGQPYLDEYRLVRDCISGQVYDSSPVDFTSDLGTKFVLHPTVLQISRPPRLVSWIANGIAFGLDKMFVNRFESQRAEYWQTLYSSVSIGAPFLILCSEDDDLAPYQIICNFAKRLQELGGDVKVVKWKSSPHVGHYRHYPTDYKAAMTELLGKATLVYSRRIQKLQQDINGGEGAQNGLSESICNLRKAAVTSNQSLLRVAMEPNDPFDPFLPSTPECHDGKQVGSAEQGLIHLPNPPSINAHGILGQILFDVCVPKNIEEWDIKPSSSFNGQTFVRRHSPFNPIKCIRRSRL
ncbi:hypothetical protein GIB67_023445 [Kingdonia uniflora]|uniref:Uncharacterized protein n=1 Tax=Kingdonia uniflora TaxID=39325 RepID=A0A7J7PAI4_9MAGN|nr:hypothetical protein GIB67_023445 [Kingdonia uniflora]